MRALAAGHYFGAARDRLFDPFFDADGFRLVDQGRDIGRLLVRVTRF